VTAVLNGEAAPVEGARPDRRDVIGASVALVGAGMIVFAVRS
jgi:drug/metabolite transporter superfamily protein YnfA